MIKGIAQVAGACCIAVSSVNSATAADNDQDRRYETVWNIQTDETQIGTRSVIVGRPVIEQRLLPFGLAMTDDDILSESGDVLVNKGEQLFQLRVAMGRSFCVAGVPRPSAFRSLMLGGGSLQLCLIDSDADGIFDGHFNGGNPMRGVPFIKGKLPKNPKGASGRYSVIAPDKFAQKYTVRISPINPQVRTAGESVISYHIDFGDDQTRQGLTSTISGKLGRTSILGAQWEATEITQSAVKVDIVSAMPSQPFQIERTVTYR